MQGRAVLVVGASAGIGRAFALGRRPGGRRGGAGRPPARPPGGGRRRAASPPGPRAAPRGSSADACDAGDCERLVREAVALVGPLDLVLYSAGSAPLRALVDTDADDWHGVLATNVVGRQPGHPGGRRADGPRRRRRRAVVGGGPHPPLRARCLRGEQGGDGGVDPGVAERAPGRPLRERWSSARRSRPSSGTGSRPTCWPRRSSTGAATGCCSRSS